MATKLTSGVIIKYADAITAAMKQELITGRKRVTGRLINSIQYKFTMRTESGMKLSWNMIDYGYFIDHGRSAGSKAPPIEEIEKWVKKKRIPHKNGGGRQTRLIKKTRGRSYNAQVRSAAFAIARAIGRDGFNPKYETRNFTSHAAEVLKSTKFRDDMNAAIKADIDSMLSTKIKNIFKLKIK